MSPKKRNKITKGRQRYYKPRSYRLSSEIRYWRKRFIFSTVGIALLIALLWFGGIALFSNINSFWSMLGRGNDSTPPATNEDTLAPRPPQINPLPKATKEETLDVSGVSENESKVVLFLNNKRFEETFTDEDGKFLFENVKLKDGENELYALATDKADNTSESSGKIKVSLVKDAPTVVIESPENGAEFNGKPESTIYIKGTVSAGSKLTVNDTIAILNDDGTFNFPLTLDKNGENEIRVVATDSAGNSTEEKITVVYNESGDEEEN